MRIVVAALTFFVAAGASSVSSVAAGPSDESASAAERARVLTTNELHSLYGNRSWMWKDGAAYFKVSKREFTSSVNSGLKASYADGVWFLTDQGRLCFRATWTAVGGSSISLKCFEHRTDGKNIYQRKVPDGTWYVFSHRPIARDDEITKLKVGDHVSARYRRNKRFVTENAPTPKCSTNGTVPLLCHLFGR
ncbi:DUF995 domain-containing protein [Mesorhizobium erdmanii]|nr:MULTISPECIES: DUF995 domain-containing protein [Mesorhizobium]